MDFSQRELITLLLTSSLLSALLTSLLTGVFSLLGKKREYRSAYYKEVLQRRLDAYEFVDTQISMLKSSVYDKDRTRMYHFIFAHGVDEFYKFHQNLFFAVSKALWISPPTQSVLLDMNRLFVSISEQYDLENQLVEAGKHYYFDIANMRDRLEAALLNDLRDLDNIPKFLKQKQTEEKSYVQLDKVIHLRPPDGTPEP
jgi:hypothetical protein